MSGRRVGTASVPLPALMLITEPHPRLHEIVAAAVRGGVDFVQLRDKIAAGEALRAQAQALRSFLRDTLPGAVVPIVVNGAAGTPLPEGTDGWHLPEETPLLSRYKGEPALVGRSVHSHDTAIRAAYEGADYLIAGTVYPSASHPGAGGQGIPFLQELCAAVRPLPVLAIGGITPARVAECIAAGASGVAVLSPLMQTSAPEAVARRYRQELDIAWKLQSTENP